MSSEPLYRRVLGVRFEALPDAVQTLHDVRSLRRWRGACAVERGTGLVARIAAWVSGLPQDTRGVIAPGFAFEVRPDAEGEVWARGFHGTGPFVTRQWMADGLLCERAGLLTMGFALEADGEGLRLMLARCWMFGVPMPRSLYPRIDASETSRDGMFWFDVAARFPTGGLFVRYRGWLRPEDT